MLIRFNRRKGVALVFEMISQFKICKIFNPGCVYEKPLSRFNSARILCFQHSESVERTKQCVSKSVGTSSSVGASRFSRGDRMEAQVALFDYLYCTRGFHYTDAERISKNSPRFVQNLLCKVDGEQDVSRGLAKFFRYNPINEFEPFLESLGLSSSELEHLLPRDLFFLGDDHILLENFHVLCEYGIPQCKIGRIFKEANDIFRYEYGILAKKLSAYEELGLSRTTVIKLVTCCPSLLVGSVNIEFVQVLEKLKQLGFGTDWIGGYLSDFKTYNWNRMLDTINFLADVGYNDIQMGLLFQTSPSLLFEGSGKRVYILVCRLLKLGLKMSQVYSLFSKNPQISSENYALTLWKAVDFLSEIGMETEAIAKVVTEQMPLLSSHHLKGPRTVLKSLKVDKATLCHIIKEDTSKLISLASKVASVNQTKLQNPSKYLEKTTFLLSLGYLENTEEMAKARKQFRGRGDQLEERFDCLVQAGLDYNVVSSMIRHAPSVLNQSKEVLVKKIDCLKSCLGYPPESIVAFPSYLCYDIGRINLRFSMYAWLRKQGASKPNLSVSTLLVSSDARFVKYFVNIHPEGPVMWEYFRKSLNID
ncbi:transcription termination factor MTEF18, mitochondrial [Apium graveolens]|uniref:transcription termination factor MTEF18, mitochondrial n=1 Tax=Apium graveolens TaxID=4045 RepID=UPI003D79E514